MYSILQRYPSTPPSSKWWQSPIPRNEKGIIVIVQDIDKEYAACVYRKIRHEWPYYKQVVAQNQYRHLYACCDSGIDDCHHMLTPEGELCHCQRWKQLWDQDVFENYRISYPWDRPDGEWVGAVKDLADRVMCSFEREDNGQSPCIAFVPPPNNIDFDDFHPYPLTFKDALIIHDVPRLSEDFQSVVPMDLDVGHKEVDPGDRDIDPELVEMDTEKGPVEESFPNGSHSGREASGSELSSAANRVIGNVSAIEDVGTGTHAFDDDVPEDIILDDADPNEENSNGLVPGIHDPSTQNNLSSLQLFSNSFHLVERRGSWTSGDTTENPWGSQRRGSM